MQLIDFALIGLAAAAPVAQVSEIKEATTCPDLNGAQVLSNNNQAYRLDCGKWVDADQVLRITTTEIGYKGCLTACDGTIDCGLSQYIATDDAQQMGSCTLFKKDAPVKDGASNSWTLATKIETTCPAPGSTDSQGRYSCNPAHQYPNGQTCELVEGCYFLEYPTTIPVPGPDDKFGLIAIRSGSPVQNTGITASKGRLTVGGKQDASCDKPDTNFATFYIDSEGSAFLYAASATPQQLWVDASGMGQGIVGYTTGAQPTPRNASRGKFAVDADGHLTFEGISAQACPTGSEDTGYSLWFSTLEKPGYNEGCLPIALRAIKADEPVGCFYSESS